MSATYADEFLDLPTNAEAEEANAPRADTFDLEARVRALRLDREARRLLAAEDAADVELPDAERLDDLIAADIDAPRWRIDGLWPAGARVNLAAAAKSGKTTTVGNVVRALVDGEDFLDHTTAPIDGSVVVFDTEMTRLQLQDWHNDLGIRNQGRVRIAPFLGCASALDFVTPQTRARLAAKYGGAHTYILDPLGPVLTSLGLDENSNTDVQRFLTAWDEFVALMGGKESVVTMHAGHNAERARGASAFLGSGSAVWTLMRESDNADATRFFKAQGRDVNVHERAVVHDAVTRRLSLGQGNRKDAKAAEALPVVLEVLRRHKEGLSGRGVEAELADSAEVTQKQVRDALKMAHREGLTFTFSGPKNATMHTLKRGEAK